MKLVICSITGRRWIRFGTWLAIGFGPRRFVERIYWRGKLVWYWRGRT